MAGGVPCEIAQRVCGSACGDGSATGSWGWWVYRFCDSGLGWRGVRGVVWYARCCAARLAEDGDRVSPADAAGQKRPAERVDPPCGLVPGHVAPAVRLLLEIGGGRVALLEHVAPERRRGAGFERHERDLRRRLRCRPKDARVSRASAYFVKGDMSLD